MKKKLLAIIATVAMVVTMIPSMVFADLANVAQIGSQGYPSLQAALDAASTAAGDYEIVLSSGTIDEDVTVDQKSGINITIKGNNTTFKGQIFIDGNGRSAGAETLTIDNVDFNTSENNHHFIKTSTNTSPKENYPHNLTVKNSSFSSTASQKYPAIYWAQGFKLDVINCTADGLMSLINTKSGTGPITVKETTITNCGNGIMANAATVSIIDCKISTLGPCVVGDASARRTLTIENSEINGEIPVLIRKAANASYKLVINGKNKMVATNEDKYLIVVTSANGTDYVEPTTMPIIEINDEGIIKDEGGLYISSNPEPVPEEPSTPAPEKPEKSPNTGDNSLPYTLAVAGLALAAMAAVVATRRRTN